MIKKLVNFLINSLLIIIFIYIFLYSKIVKETIIWGINIWINSLIPSIFPFLLVSKLLVKYNTISKLFKISNNKIFVVLLSIITGFPSGSIYIKELLDKNEISIDDANKMIAFTSFSNPLFVISVIGETLLNSKKFGIIIYIIHLITGLSIMLLFRININSSKSIKHQNNNYSFIKNLIDSINESFIVLINMLGIVLFFLIIISIMNTFISNNTFTLFLKGLIEITNGVILISKSRISIKLKASLIGAIISFNGLSVHYQVKNNIENTNIKYKNFILARIIHSILCFIIIYIII